MDRPSTIKVHEIYNKYDIHKSCLPQVACGITMSKSSLKKNTRTKLLIPSLSWTLVLKLLFGLGLLSLVYIGYNTTRPVNAPIKKVKIVATYKHIQPQTLQNAITPFIKNGFYHLNLTGLQHKLLEMPWVYKINIQRTLLNTLKITVDEQQPAAKWNNHAILNTAGEMFTPAQRSIPTDIPELFGPPNTARIVFSYYQKIQHILQPLGVTIKELDLKPLGAWHVTLTNGTKIHLGHTDIFNRLHRLVKIYPTIAAKHRDGIKTIDLRYNDGIAIQ